MTNLYNKFLGIFLYLFFLTCNSPEVNKDNFRFNKIEIPEGWYDNSPEDEILNRINVFGKNQLDSLIKSSDLNLKNFTEINYYTKYDIYNDNPDSYKFIPSIRVHLLKNYLDMDIIKLKTYYENSISGWENLGFENVNIIKSNLLYSQNKKIVEIIISYNFLNPYTNILENLRSRQYYLFISENYYLQISMNDSEDNNCNKVFDKILDSILIKKAQT